jgi:hypothetical protein
MKSWGSFWPILIKFDQLQGQIPMISKNNNILTLQLKSWGSKQVFWIFEGSRVKRTPWVLKYEQQVAYFYLIHVYTNFLFFNLCEEWRKLNKK